MKQELIATDRKAIKKSWHVIGLSANLRIKLCMVGQWVENELINAPYLHPELHNQTSSEYTNITVIIKSSERTRKLVLTVGRERNLVTMIIMSTLRVQHKMPLFMVEPRAGSGNVTLLRVPTTHKQLQTYNQTSNRIWFIRPDQFYFNKSTEYNTRAADKNSRCKFSRKRARKNGLLV